MFEWLWAADNGVILGAFGFLTGLASLLYARSQARGAKAQVEAAGRQAVEALIAAQLVAKGAQETAAEALRAAELVAKGARETAAEALIAAQLVAKGAQETAAEALRAAELVAEGARQTAAEALRAAKLVAQGAQETAAEALRAAELVAAGARETAAEALRAAELVAENARQQAVQAVRAAELLANSAVSARVREVRGRNLQSNPSLPQRVQAVIQEVGGPDAYSLMLDSVDVAQEIYVLRTRGMVSDDNWRMWMNDQMDLIAGSPSFKTVFHRAAQEGVLRPDFVNAFESVFEGRQVEDPFMVAGTPTVSVRNIVGPRRT